MTHVNNVNALKLYSIFFFFPFFNLPTYYAFPNLREAKGVDINYPASTSVGVWGQVIARVRLCQDKKVSEGCLV